MSESDEKRLKGMRRIADLHRQMKRMEELRLARLLREEADLEEKRVAIVTTLNEDSSLHGLFVDHMAARLKRITEKKGLLAPLKEQQVAAVMSETRQTRFAETMIGGLEAKVAATEEKRELESLIGAALARRHQTSQR